MNEPEIDDVAFLTGESAKKLTLYGEGTETQKKPRVGFSKPQLCLFASIFILLILLIALLATVAQPRSQCPRSLPQPVPITTEAPTPPPNPLPWQDIRLPSTLEAITYSLFLVPNLTTFINSGQVNITFRSSVDVDYIVLHSKHINLTSLEARDGRDKAISIENHQIYEPYEQLFIKFSEKLKANEVYTVVIDFFKRLEESLDGFYLSSYKTSTGEKRYLATSHFEPTAARSAFPCFDEPAFKAIFQLRVIHSNQHKAYFNSELESVDPFTNDLLLSTFKPTVRMSTYLVAFVVCDFASAEQENQDHVKIRVLAPQEQISQAQFALETASQILYDYHQFFNVAYPLQKLDMIAIPDFGPGAMENWGLITFRMTTILYNENETSSESQEHVATVIAHELAHQWFGNLVTMKWWSDLWLNEGFASFVEFLGVNFLKPEWNMMDQFIVETTQEALDLDSLQTSHPIMADVEDPLAIEGIFDSISYKKGASIIHMLESFIGRDALKRGLNYYLNKYRYDNAETKDLWDSFTIVSKDLNVAAIMDTWTKQMGFPLVTVTMTPEKKVMVNQTRFVLNGQLTPSNYSWMIPLTYVVDNDLTTPHMYWLNKIEGEFDLDPSTQWLKANVNQSGFYRVNYDLELWQILIDQLLTNHKLFNTADRASLLDDALTLSRVGVVPCEVGLNLTQYLVKEREYVAWETVLNHFDFLDVMLHDSPSYLEFKKYMLELITPTLDEVGWIDTGTHLTKKLRHTILAVAVKYGHKPTIEEARKRFRLWVTEGQKIEPNLRGVIYGTGIKYGGVEEWQYCWNKYQTSQTPSEQKLLLTALGTSTSTWQLSQYLQATLDKDKVRPQDVTTVIGMSARNTVGRLMTWRFVRTNWDAFYQMFGQGSFSMDYIISEVTSSFSTKFDYKEVKCFFNNVKVGVGGPALNHSLERIEANVRWKSKIQPSVDKWLKDHFES